MPAALSFSQLWPFLTAREHIEFAVALFQPSMHRSERDSLVAELLDEMGLTQSQHTRAGLPPLVSGLSGGEKRRLSLAVALAKKPHVVFLDEPTSGLDAAAAVFVTRFLITTARRLQLSVFCTIHQPSSDVFASFDRVGFLTGGKLAYIGAASGLPAYLEGIGKPVPTGSNPADFMLGLINRQFSDPAVVDETVQAWAKHVRLPSFLTDSEATKKSVSFTRAPWPATPPRSRLRQSATLLRRGLHLLKKAPVMYLGRIVFLLLSTSLFAVFYYKTRTLSQPVVIERVYFLDFLTVMPGLAGMITVVALSFDWAAIQTEIREGMYDASAFLLVQTLIELPMLLVLALVSLVPAAFGIGAFSWSGFSEAYAVTLTTQLFLESIAQLLSLLPNAILGMLAYVGVWFFAYLCAGVPIKPSDTPQPLRTAIDLLPYRWSFATTAHAAFAFVDDVPGTARCNNVTMLAIDGYRVTERAGNVSLAGTPVMCNSRGFYCPEHSAALCYGRTGAQLLESLSTKFETLTPDDHATRDALNSLAIALVFKLLYCAVFLLRIRLQRRPLRFTPLRESRSADGVRTAAELEKDSYPKPIKSDAEGQGKEANISSAVDLARASSRRVNLARAKGKKKGEIGHSVCVTV